MGIHQMVDSKFVLFCILKYLEYFLNIHIYTLCIQIITYIYLWLYPSINIRSWRDFLVYVYVVLYTMLIVINSKYVLICIYRDWVEEMLRKDSPYTHTPPSSADHTFTWSFRFNKGFHNRNETLGLKLENGW